MSKYLYLIQAVGTNFFKIGITKNPQKRLNYLSTASPYPLVFRLKYLVENDLLAEKFIHEEWELYRRNGEWFELPDHLLEALFQDFESSLDLLPVEENKKSSYYTIPSIRLRIDKDAEIIQSLETLLDESGFVSMSQLVRKILRVCAPGLTYDPVFNNRVASERLVNRQDLDNWEY